jgi:MoaA/NifB/PqqE/SkfB family radical SAM enzyme
MSSVVESQISKFNETRRIAKPTSICYAPSLAMNFDQTGRVTACCFNRSYVLGTYPKNAIQDIWEGEAIQKMRQALKKNDLSLGCQQCERMLHEENFESVLITHFDDYYPYLGKKKSSLLAKLPFFNKKSGAIDLVPRVFEFELSNTCNLECIMCGGLWSSSIRQNREGLPKLENPYDASFVLQIRPFLKDLRRANFLGGEPFLIKIYFDLWEAIIEENADIEVAITSNGTVMNSRIKGIIKKLPKCKITLSIDSLVKETWESIRVNGNFESLLANIDWLLESGKLVSFSVCPMIQNWKEIPNIIAYCEERHLDIFFNIVYGPLGERQEGIHKVKNGELVTDIELIPETSLSRLSAPKLSEVIALYEAQSFKPKYQNQLNNLINQLKFWRKENNYD